MDYETAYHLCLIWAIISTAINIGQYIAMRKDRSADDSIPPIVLPADVIERHYPVEKEEPLIEETIIEEETLIVAKTTIAEAPMVEQNWVQPPVVPQDDKPVINTGEPSHDRPNFRD